MPTVIATLGRERTVATLSRRVYQLEENADPALQKRAEAALLEANPRLATGEGFRSGDSIVVPPVRGLEPSDAVRAAEPGGGGLAAEARLRLEAMTSRIDDGFRRAAERRKTDIGRLDDSKFTATARKALPQSAELLAKSRERLAEEEKTAGETAERFRKTTAAAIEGLSEIEALFAKLGPR